MTAILALVISLAISMVVIPIMFRLAPGMGLVDIPSERKVHAQPIPRVGGWGIVLGTLIAVAIFAPLDDKLVQAYLFGSVVLLLFGTWDDAKEVGHYPKFIGQFLAVIPVVTYADLTVTRLPFMGTETLPPEFSIPFTIVAIIGVINALNHSDGLDGLAGGEGMLSLIAVTLLCYNAEGTFSVIIGMAVIGGILGFLRFNTHPARLFMGDSGSQFLGFSLAILVVHLTSNVNPALSPAIPALLLGLPVVDIVTVLFQRAYGGMNWFKATRNHVHHRLLDLGFIHYEAVVIIYGLQVVMVISGVMLGYSWDSLILALYFSLCVALFGLLLGAKSRGWRVHEGERESELSSSLFCRLRNNELLRSLPAYLILLIVPAFLVLVSLSVSQVPRDFAVISAILGLVVLLELFNKGSGNRLLRRIVIYVNVLFVVFLSVSFPFSEETYWVQTETGLYAFVALLVAFSVRFSSKTKFQTTPMDYLIVFVILVLSVFVRDSLEDQLIVGVIIKGIILLYASELILNERTGKWTLLSMASLASLAILTVRGGML